jgi:DNA-binding PadR family transcriptional regulator
MHPHFKFRHHSPHQGGRGMGGGGHHEGGHPHDKSPNAETGDAGHMAHRSQPGHAGRHGQGGPNFERGNGRRERMFEAGALKLVVLYLLAAQARHGYDLIRAIGELAGGDYTPSPGTIYPTLNLLEDMGLVQATEPASARKQYTLTAAGTAELAEQAQAVQAIMARLAQGKAHADRRRVPELQRAMDNLKNALRLRFDGQAAPDQATVQRVAAILDQAAIEIERA